MCDSFSVSVHRVDGNVSEMKVGGWTHETGWLVVVVCDVGVVG